MRIVCEQCQTKYVYPDDKIVKNVLRLTCQKCGHVITTRVDGKENDEVSESGTLGKLRMSGLNTPRKLQNEAPTWYYSYNGESIGPFTEQELKDRLLSDKLAPMADQGYVWNKTFTDWKPVLEVEPFASALMMPPPPPPPAPAPKRVPDESMPPLFSAQSPTQTSMSSLSNSPKSSPDLSGLKMRLKTPGTGGMPDRQRESLARLASSSMFGKIETGKSRQDDVPTHPAMPAVDELEPVEEAGDRTHVRSPMPLVSFQSLDAISPDIKAETKDGASVKMVRPFPSIGSAQTNNPSTKSASVTSRPAFGAASNPAPNISSLFGQKTPSSAGVGSGATGTPRFAGLSSIASGSQTGLPRFGGVSAKAPATSLLKTPSSVNSTVSSDDAALEYKDDKEDIGAIVSEGAVQSVSRDAAQDDSISSWLPSQSDLRLESKIDGLSVSEILLNSSDDLIGKDSAEDSLPSLDLGEVDLDKDKSQSSAVTSAVIPATSTESGVLPDIDLNENSAIPSAVLESSEPDLGDLDLEDENANSMLPGTVNEPELAALDLEDDPNGSTNVDALTKNAESSAESDDADDEEHKLVSSFDMLSMVRQSSSSSTAVPSKPAAASDISSDSVDLGEIDLDDDASQFIANSVVEEIRAGQVEDLNEISTLGAADDLFADAPVGEPAVAKARHHGNSLDEIAARHADLFAELEAAQPAEEPNDSGISEHSMMIQLAHIQKIQTKEKNKSKLGIIIAAVVIGLVVVGAIFGGIVLKDSEKTVVADNSAFDKTSGRTISSDELDEKLVPIDDFEIIDAGPIPVKSGSSHSRRSAESNSGDSGSESAAAQAADAIYGNHEQAQEQAQEKAKQPAVRQDGRANVQFGNSGDFASTAGVQGSKYAVKGGASSRDAFTAGLTRVSKSVQDCARRSANQGDQMPPKIYLNLTIQPEGNVDSFKIQDAQTPEKFNKCLESKKDTWKFSPFEGNPVSIRQAFILG